MHRAALATRTMRLIRQRMHTGSVNPPVIKIKQRAYGDSEINRLIGPTHRIQWPHVLVRYLGRIVVDFGNEPEKRLFFLRQSRAFQIFQHAPHQVFVPQQLSRNCGVRFQSKRTIVPIGRVGGDQLPDARRKRRLLAHDFLRKPRQVFGGSRQERKHVPDLRIFGAPLLHHPHQIAIRARLRILLNPR